MLGREWWRGEERPWAVVHGHREDEPRGMKESNLIQDPQAEQVCFGDALPRPPEHPIPLLQELPVRPQRRLARHHDRPRGIGPSGSRRTSGPP